jgi:hypothetical protein
MPQPTRVIVATVDQRIHVLRGERVILDFDLAQVYGVTTKALNQAVRRNRRRFPQDFAFRLTRAELKILRSQFVTASRNWGGRRQPPRAFTEHGAIMAAALLNSLRAVEMSVYVVRAFVRLRNLARSQTRLAVMLRTLERRVAQHDVGLKRVIAAVRQLMEPPSKARRPIGFLPPAAPTRVATPSGVRRGRASADERRSVRPARCS